MVTRSPVRSAPVAAGHARTRLPWWALALPTLAFLTLLVLILHPAHAQAASAQAPALGALLDRVGGLLVRVFG
ncbi:hypothetical protein AB0J21_12045 [Streptomyces sp. NPDC049954]|uniref:hypothetical protein n=1 Tax=Streptomyces sp. NPDC049954 TaxID=3155779 RepID=UPI003428ADC7